MKCIFFFSFGLLFWACSNTDSNRIEVHYTERGMTTANPVPCIELEAGFSNFFQKKESKMISL